MCVCVPYTFFAAEAFKTAPGHNDQRTPAAPSLFSLMYFSTTENLHLHLSLLLRL